MTAHETAKDLFDRYTEALLGGDVAAVARFYAVPALIERPEQRLALSSAEEVASFIVASASAYAGVRDLRHEMDVAAATEHSVWADVTWHFTGRPPERDMYQLVLVKGEWRIAVMTPLAL
mgnify:CR=1 FL=1